MFIGLGLGLGMIRSTGSGALLTPVRFDSTLARFDSTLWTMDQDVDTTPDAFTIPAISDAELDTTYLSDPVQLQGMNAPATFTAPGGTVVVNEEDLGSSGSVPANALFKAALRSSTSNSTATQVNVTIGGVSAPFIITTKAPSPAPTPTPTPTPPETLMTRRGGTPDYIVTNGSNTAAGGLGKAMADALAAMNSDGQRKVIAMQAGNYGNVFPSGGKNYPAQLDIINLDDANPAIFNRFEVNSQQNILIDGLYVNYIPSAYSSPVVIVRNSTNVQLHNHVNIGQRGRGRRLQILGGTDVTIYRANIKGGGDQLISVAQKESSTIPTINPRVIECNLTDGDTDGIRIFGAQDYYLARNCIHEIVFPGGGGHNDYIQATMHATASLRIPSNGSCLDHLHYAMDGTQLAEGFQMTNMLWDDANPVYMGVTNIRRMTLIGNDGAGIAHRGCTGGEIEGNQLYYPSYNGTDPTIAIAGSTCSVMTGNGAHAGLTIGTFQPVSGGTIYTSTVSPNNAVSSGSSMAVTNAERDALIAAWRAANPGVPT